MFLAIIDNRSGAYETLRRLSPTELLDCDHHACKFAADYGMALAEDDGWIPAGSGDFRVELRASRDCDWHVWSAHDYFFVQE